MGETFRWGTNLDVTPALATRFSSVYITRFRDNKEFGKIKCVEELQKGNS